MNGWVHEFKDEFKMTANGENKDVYEITLTFAKDVEFVLTCIISVRKKAVFGLERISSARTVTQTQYSRLRVKVIFAVRKQASIELFTTIKRASSIFIKYKQQHNNNKCPCDVLLQGHT